MSKGQNVDNFLSERSSTRIHAPAGGRSTAGSLIFGGGANESSAKVSSNKFATGSNQNCGNFMTGRSSTRLHAPPGGSSEAGSLIFGGGYSASSKPAARGRKPAAKAVSAKPGAIAAPAPVKENKAAASNATASSSSVAQIGARKSVSANRFATGSNQNCGNVITDRPTSRVLAPPGGRSSGPLW